jgi:hypothetical protein
MQQLGYRIRSVAIQIVDRESKIGEWSTAAAADHHSALMSGVVMLLVSRYHAT